MSGERTKAANSQDGRLSPALRDKLAKVLALMSSDFDAEALAAARRATA
jgi:hypothetical protein